MISGRQRSRRCWRTGPWAQPVVEPQELWYNHRVQRETAGTAPAATSLARPNQNQVALLTLPALMHDVQTLVRRLPCGVAMRTDCKFGSHRRLVWRWEWLTLHPVEGRFPQIAHTLDILQQPLTRNAPSRRRVKQYFVTADYTIAEPRMQPLSRGSVHRKHD